MDAGSSEPPIQTWELKEVFRQIANGDGVLTPAGVAQLLRPGQHPPAPPSGRHLRARARIARATIPTPCVHGGQRATAAA